MINTALRVMSVEWNNDMPAKSHAFKRGTVSVLDSLGYPTLLLNAHVGWVPMSTCLAIYRRPVQVTQVDRDFF